MTEQNPAPERDPAVGQESALTGQDPALAGRSRGAEGQTSTNQAKTEPAGQGNVSPGTGSSGSGQGGSGIGTDQPDRAAAPGTGRSVGEPAREVPGGGGGPDAGGAAGDGGLGVAYRQPQRYGASPDPIGTDDVAGARAATPGGAPEQPKPGHPETGAEADATSGLRMPAMPGTSEAAPRATGVRRAAFEGSSDDPQAGDVPAGGLEVPVAQRRTGGSGPGSSAASRGETPQPPVEQTQTGEQEPGETHERPVTGVHRPQSPSGEVSPG